MGLADRGTVHITGEEQRQDLGIRGKKKETIDKQNQSVNRLRPVPHE